MAFAWPWYVIIVNGDKICYYPHEIYCQWKVINYVKLLRCNHHMPKLITHHLILLLLLLLLRSHSHISLFALKCPSAWRICERSDCAMSLSYKRLSHLLTLVTILLASTSGSSRFRTCFCAREAKFTVTEPIVLKELNIYFFKQFDYRRGDCRLIKPTFLVDTC